MPKITFNAEIREVKSRKLISLDKEITVKLNTNQLQALKLAEIEADKLVTVNVEWE